MTSISSLAVAAPTVHTQVNSAPQSTASPVSEANYLGGAAILFALAVMMATGLSAAGMIKPRQSAKSVQAKAPHTAH